MPTSTDELLKATGAARALLDQLRLSAYTFAVGHAPPFNPFSPSDRFFSCMIP